MIGDDATIVAVATAEGVGPRCVLRASGPLAVDCVEAIVVESRALKETRGFQGKSVVLRVGGAELPAWAVVFRAPRSYTREDVVELHLPGSVPIVSAVSRALVVQDGVRWAGPGEFTLRAFRNGRIDLTQAESIAALIAATGEHEALAARRALDGALGAEVADLADRLTEAIALVEAGIDFADEALPEVSSEALVARIDDELGRLSRLRRSTSLRRATLGAAKAVITGFPNAGKSSLLNALLGRETALVSEHVGTTRDPVRGLGEWRGRRIEWVDLAGTFSLFSAEEAPEGLDRALEPEALEAVRRLARVELESADVVIRVIDATSPSRERERSLRQADAVRASVVVAWSKADLLETRSEQELSALAPASVVVSSRSGRGLDALRDAVLRAALGRSVAGPAPEGGRYLVSARQEASLEAAQEALRRGRRALLDGLGAECASADLRDALRALGELTGRVTSDEILGHVFSRFCVGK